MIHVGGIVVIAVGKIGQDEYLGTIRYKVLEINTHVKIKSLSSGSMYSIGMGHLREINIVEQMYEDSRIEET